jgi:hypothetical protein
MVEKIITSARGVWYTSKYTSAKMVSINHVQEGKIGKINGKSK